MTGRPLIYVVMTNYGLEGWKISGETDSLDGAFLIWKESLSNGNTEVEIFIRVNFGVNGEPK